eukprot:g3544.t1
MVWELQNFRKLQNFWSEEMQKMNPVARRRGTENHRKTESAGEEASSSPGGRVLRFIEGVDGASDLRATRSPSEDFEVLAAIRGGDAKTRQVGTAGPRRSQDAGDGVDDDIPWREQTDGAPAVAEEGGLQARSILPPHLDEFEPHGHLLYNDMPKNIGGESVEDYDLEDPDPSRSDERSRSRASSKGNSGRGPLPQRRKGQGKQGKAAKRLAKGTASEKGMWDRYSRCRGEHDGATADDGGPTATAERDVGSCVPGDYNQQAIIHMHESDGVDGDETARGRLDAEVEHQKSFWSTSDDETTNAGFYRRLNIRQKQGRCSAARDGEGHCHQGAQDHHEEHFHQVEHERPSEEIKARVDRDPWDPRTCLERFDARRHDLRLHAFWLTEVPHRRYVTWWDPEHGRKRVWRIPTVSINEISNCRSTSAATKGDWAHDHHGEEEEEPAQRGEASFCGAFHQFCDGVAPQRGPRGRGGKRTHHPRSGRSKKKTRGAGDGGKKSEARSEAVAKRRRRAGSSSTNTSTCSSGTSVSSDDNNGPHPVRALRRAKEKRRKDRANAEAEREEEQPTLFLLYDVGDARVWESVKKAVVEVVESHSAWNEEGFGKADQAWDSAVNPPRQGKFFRDGEIGNEVLARVGDKLRTLDRGVDGGSLNAGQEVDRRQDEEDPDGLPTAAAVEKEGTLAVRKKTPPRTFAEAIAVKKRRHEKKRQRAQKRKMQREQRKALKEATTACSAENAKNAKQGGRKAGDPKSAKPRGAQSFDEMLKEVDRCLADHSRMKRVFADSAIQKALWPEVAVVHDDAALRRENHTSCWSGSGGSSEEYEQGGEQMQPQAEEAGGEFSTPRKPSFSRGARHSTPKTREELDDSDEDLVAEACHAIVQNMQQTGENSSGQALPNAAGRPTRSSALDDEKVAFLALARRLLATFRAAMKDAASDRARAPWPRKKAGLAGRQQVREQLAAAKSVEDGLHVLRKVLRARIEEERTLEVANREQDVKEILTDPVRALQWSHLRSQLPLQFQDEATRWRAEYEAAVRLRTEQEDAESGDESAVQLKLAHTRLVAPWKYNRWRRALGAMTGVHVPKYRNKQLGSPEIPRSGDKIEMKEKEPRSERWFDPEVAARRRGLYESYLSTKFGAISHHPHLETERKLHEIYGDAHVGIEYSCGGEDELGPRRAFVSEVERMCYVDWLGKVAARRSADGSQPLREMLLSRTAEFAEKKWDMLSVFREACRAECLPATAAEEDEHRREMKGSCSAGGGDEHGNEEGTASAADASAQASDVGAEEENAREPADAISSPSQGEEQTTVPAPPPVPLAPDLPTAFDAAALIEKVRLASTVPPELVAKCGGVLGHFLPAETEKDEFLTFVYAQECRQFVGGRIFEAWPREIALQLMNMGYAGKNLIRDLRAAPQPATTAPNDIPSPEGLLDFWTRYQICDRKVQAGKIKSAGLVTQHWMEFDLERCTDGTEVERESLKSTFNQAKNPVNYILRTLFENDGADRPVGQVGGLAANKSLLSDKLRTPFPPMGNIPSLPHIQRALEDARRRGHLDPINCDPEEAEEFETLALSILERQSQNREDDEDDLLANFVHDWNRFKYGFTDSNWSAMPALDPVLEQQRVLEVEKKKWMQREEHLAERGINLSSEIGRGVSGGEDVNASRTRARQLRMRMEELDDDFLSPGADSETHVAGGISIDGEGMSTSSSTDAGEDEDEAEDLSRDSATAERSRADYAQQQQQQWAQAPSSYGAAGAEDYQDEGPDEARERHPEPPLLRPAPAKRRRTRAVHGEIDAGELASASDDQGLGESEDTFSPGGEEGCEKMRLETDRSIRKQKQRRGDRTNTAVEESCAAVTCSGSLLRAPAAQRGRFESAEEQSSVPKRSESSVFAAFRDRSVPGAAVDETGQSFRAEKRDLSPPAVREHDETAGRGARVEDYCREDTQKDEQVDYNDWSWSQHDWKSWNADVEDEGRGCAPPNAEVAEEVRRLRNDPYVSSALSCAAKGSPISLEHMRETWWEQSKQGRKMGLTESEKEEHRQRFPFGRDAIDAQVARDAALDGLTANRGTDGYHTAGDVLNSAHMSLTASLNTVKAKKVRLHDMMGPDVVTDLYLQPGPLIDEVTELLRHDQVMVENAFQEQLNGTYDKYRGHRDVEGIFFKRVLDPEDIDGMIGCIDQVAWEFAQHRDALRVRRSLEQRDARREATLEVDDEALLPSFVLNPMNKHAADGQESWGDDEDDDEVEDDPLVGEEGGGAGAGDAVVGLGADGVAPGAGPTPEDENQQSGVADAGADLLIAPVAGGANNDAAREGAGEAAEASAAAAKVDHLAKARKKGRTLQQAAAAKANAGSSLRVASDRRATETHFPSQAKIFERLGEVDENVKLRLAFAARLQNLVERKLGIQRQKDVRGAARGGDYYGEQDHPTAAATVCDVNYPHLAFMYVEQFRAIFLHDPNAGGHRSIQLMCWYPPPGELAALAFGTGPPPPPHIVDGMPHFDSLPSKNPKLAQMEDRHAYFFSQKERGFREMAESFVCDREQDQNITLAGHWLEVCAVSAEAASDRPQYEDALTTYTRVAMERTLRKSLLAGLPRLRASEYKKLHTTFAGAPAGRGVVVPSAQAHLHPIGKRGGRSVASSSQHLHAPHYGGPRGATSTRGVRKRNSVRGGHHAVAGSPSHGQEQVARDYERRRRQWAFAWQATLSRLTPAALREACASSRHIQKMQQKARERRAPLWTRYSKNPDVPPPTPHMLREARMSRYDISRRQLHNEGRWVRAEIRNCLAGLDAGAMDYGRGGIGSAEDGFYYPADNTTVRREAARYAEEDQEREKKERHGLQHGCNHYPTIAGRASDASRADIQPNERRDQDVLQLRRKWRQRLFRNGEMQVTPIFSPDSLVYNYAVAKEVIFNEQHVLAKEHQLEVRSHEALRRKAAAVGNDDQMDLLQQVADHQDGGSCSASRYIDLPIRRYRKAFLELLHAHRILLVDGRTGTGKSTQIPLYIADDMNAQIEKLKVQQVTDVSQIPPWLRARENAAGNLYRKPRIVLTQPKRYGAIKTATSLHEMEGGDARQGPLGERIGYRVGQLAKDKNCEICFMTSTWLLQKLTHHPEALGDITHLILDEMHDRNVDIDFLCMVLKVLLAQPVFQDTKVVGKIEEFFNGCQGDYGARIPRLEIVHGTPFQITKFHVEDLGSPVFECFETWANSNATALRKKFLRTVRDKFGPKMSKFGHHIKGKNQNYKPQSQTMSQLIPSMIDLTVELLRDIFIPKAREKDAVELETAKLIERFGRTTLVFLPGQGEMNQLEVAIEQRLMRPLSFDLDVRVFWLHSSFQERGEGLKEHVKERGGRAIVLATNIAESGVTIEDVGVVIDYGMEKVSRCSDEGGSKADSLLLAWSSKASVTQRQGRTGRVRDGLALRLFPKWIWDRMDAFETSEVAREDINRTVLRCALSIAKLRERFQVVPGWMEQKQRKRVWGWDAKQDAWRLEDGTVVPETELQVETEDGFNIGQFLQMLPDPPAGAAPTVLGCAALGFTCSLPVGRMMLFAVMCGYVEEAVLLAACITALASSKGGDDFLLKTGKDMDMNVDKPDYVQELLPRRGKEGEYDDGESPEDYMKRVFEMRWQCGEWMHAWRTMFNGDTYSEVSALYKVLEYILQCQNGNDEFAVVPLWANWNEGRHNVENPDELGVPQIPPLPGVARSHPEIFQTTQQGGGNRMIPGSRGGGAPPPPGPPLSGQGLRRLNKPLEKEMLRRKAWIDVQDRVLDLCQNFTREVHYDWVTKRVENLAQAVKLRGRRVPIQLRKDFDPNFWIGFAFAGTHLGVSRGEVAAQVADRNYRLCRELPNPDRLCRKKENPPGSKEKKPERNALKVFFSQALEDHETVSQRDLEAAMEEHKLGFPLISVNLRAAPGENAKNKKGAEQLQHQLAEGKGKPTKKPTTLEFHEHFIKADTQHFGRCLVPVGDTNKLMFCTRRACPENDGPVQKMTDPVLFDMTHYQYEHFCLEKRPKEKDEERLSRSEMRAVQLVKEGRQTEAARLMKREHKASASKSPKEKAKNPTAQHSHARQGRSESKGKDEDVEKGGVAGNKHLKGLRTPVPDFIIRRQRRLAAVETHRRDCFALCVASLPTTAHRGPNEHENEPHQGTKRRSAWADAFFCPKPEWMHTLERAIAIDDDVKKLPEPHSGFARQLVEHQEKRAMIISDGENGARKKRDSQGMSLFYCGSRVSSVSTAAEADQKRVKIFFYDPRFARDDPEGASAGRRPYVCALLCQAKQVFSKISRQGRPSLLRAAGSGARSSRQVREQQKWSHEWPPSLENKTYYRGYRCTRLGSLRGHVDKNFWKGRDFGKEEIALGLEKRAAKGWAEQPVAFGVANVTKLRQKKLELIRRRSGVTETTSRTTRSFGDNDNQEDAFSPPATFDEFLMGTSRSATGDLCRINRLHHGHHEAREKTDQHGRQGVDVPQQLAIDSRYRQLRRFYGELRLLHQNEYDNENDRGTADLQDLELDWEKSYSTHLEAHWFAGSVWQYLSEDLRPFEQTLFAVPQSREEVIRGGKIFDRQGLREEQRAQQQRRSNEASSHGRDRRGAHSRKSEKKERHSSTREPSEEDDRDGSESGSPSSSSAPLGEGGGRKNRPSSSRAGGRASAKYIEIADFVSEASSTSEDEGVRGSSSGTPSPIDMIIADEKKKARLSRTLAERFPYRFPPEFFDYLNRKGEQTCAAMTSLEDHWLREYFADNVNYSRAERLLSAAGVAICAGDLAASQTTQTSGISSNKELLRDWLRSEKLKYACVSKEEYWNKLQLHNERHRFFNRYLDLRDEQTQGKMEKAADREVFDQMQKNYKPRNGVLPLECEVLLRCGPPDEQYPLTWIAYEQMNMEEEEGQTRERQHHCHFGPFKLEGKEEWRLLRDKSTDYKSKVTFEPCLVDRNGTLATMLEDFSEVRLITGIAVKEKVKAGARDHAGGKNKKNQSRPKPAKRSFELSGTTLLPRLQGVDLFLMNAWPNYEIPVRYVLNAVGEPVLISVGFDYEELRIPEVNLAVINDFRRCTNLLQRRTYNPRAGRYKNNEQSRGRKAKPAGAVAATTSTDWSPPDEAAAANGETRSGGTTLGAVDAGKQELPDVEGAAGQDHTSAPNDAADDAVNATSNDHPQMMADEEEHDDEPEVPNYLEWLGDGIFCAGETYKDQKELELPKTGSETVSVARAGQRTTAGAGTGDHVGNYSVGAQTTTTPGAAATGLNHQKKRFRGEGSLGKHMQGSGQYMHMVNVDHTARIREAMGRILHKDAVSDGVYFEKQRPFSNSHNFFNKAIAAGASPFELHEHRKLRGTIPFRRRDKITRMDAEGEDAFYELMDQGFDVREGFLWIENDGEWTISSTSIERLPASLTHADLFQAVIPAWLQLLAVMQEWFRYKEDLEECGQFSRAECCAYWDARFAECFQSVNERFCFGGSGRDWWVCCYNEAKRQLESRGLDKECFANAANNKSRGGRDRSHFSSRSVGGGFSDSAVALFRRTVRSAQAKWTHSERLQALPQGVQDLVLQWVSGDVQLFAPMGNNGAFLKQETPQEGQKAVVVRDTTWRSMVQRWQRVKDHEPGQAGIWRVVTTWNMLWRLLQSDARALAGCIPATKARKA